MTTVRGCASRPLPPTQKEVQQENSQSIYGCSTDRISQERDLSTLAPMSQLQSVSRRPFGQVTTIVMPRVCREARTLEHRSPVSIDTRGIRFAPLPRTVRCIPPCGIGVLDMLCGRTTTAVTASIGNPMRSRNIPIQFIVVSEERSCLSVFVGNRRRLVLWA